MKKLIFSLLVVIMSTIACTSKNANLPNDQLNVHFPAVHLLLDPHKMEDLFSMVVGFGAQAIVDFIAQTVR